MSNTQLQQTINGTAEQLADVGRSTAKRLDNARCAAADAIASSACSARSVGRAADNIAKGAAESLQAIARYLRRNDTHDMVMSLKGAVRRHPAKFAVGALAGIFVIRHFASDRED
jgi:hypothetical protein